MRNRSLWLALVLLALASCAGPNPLLNQPAAGARVAGFFTGLGQGLIVPIAFIVSLFDRSVSIYEVHNNGAWYNFGFILGAGAWGILRGRSSRKD